MTEWPRVLLVYGIGVLAAGQLGIVPPLVPALQGELGLSLATAGAVVSLMTLVGGLLGLPAGAFAERIGHGRAFCLGLLVMALAAGLCAMAQDAAVLLAGRALAGAGYLLVVVAGPSLLATLAQPRHQPIALSLWGTFVPVGIAIAGIATAGFAESGWRTIFTVDAALLAAALVVAAPILRAPSIPHDADWRMPPGALRAALPLAVSFFCFALLFLALAGMLPAYLVERRDMTPATAGRIVAVATALGIAGSVAAAWLMHHGMTPRRLIAVGLAASTVAAILAFRPEFGVPVSITGLAVSFAIGGLVPAASFASVPRLAPGPRAIGPINGVLAQAGSLGSLAGPPVLALWVQLTSWAWAPALLLGVAAVGAIAINAPQKR
ncbi:MAG: MFS transporter [Reyranella sp.]|uniref:MFS transporter n=1 Tax=Reyranella sp. TaxID=1929291 RepID=UPI001AC067EF|nr:MFS transporter [Reyranella sp.]MBN9087523.1 MFS transporter [Reyranella sp.]